MITPYRNPSRGYVSQTDGSIFGECLLFSPDKKSLTVVRPIITAINFLITAMSVVLTLNMSIMLVLGRLHN